MFIAYIVATLLAAAANLFSATCDFVRYEQVRIAMAKARVPESWMTYVGSSQSRGRARTAARHRRATDRNGRRTRPHSVFRRRHHHPCARTRLLVRPGGRVPFPCRWNSGTATGLVVSPY
jgi:hypothetical protein